MLENGIHIRRATADDAARLAEIGAQTFREAFGAQNTPENIQAHVSATFSAEQQADEIANPENILFVAALEGELVGYAKMSVDHPPMDITGEHPVEIARIYVLEVWIGHKIGAALMQTCLDEAKKRGHDVVWLGVWEHNPRAITFYQKWGFVIVGSHGFQLGDDAQTDLLMQRNV